MRKTNVSTGPRAAKSTGASPFASTPDMTANDLSVCARASAWADVWVFVGKRERIPVLLHAQGTHAYSAELGTDPP